MNWCGQQTGTTLCSSFSGAWPVLQMGRCVSEGAFTRLAAELESGYLGQAWS